MYIAGQQEYSSRQAGITTGIVLACLIPILLVVICVGYRTLKSRKEYREHEQVLARYRMHFVVNYSDRSRTRSWLKRYDHFISERGKRNCNDCVRLARTTRPFPTVQAEPRRSIKGDFMYQIFRNVEFLYATHVSFRIIYL